MNSNAKPLGLAQMRKGKLSFVEFLSQSIRLDDEGLVYEADQKHVKTMMDEWIMSGSKSVASPGVHHETRETKAMMENLEQELLDDARKTYRGTSARMNYLAMDRADIGYAAKELSRKMQNQTAADEVRMKRVLRYLQGRPRGAYLFRWQYPCDDLKCQVDSDWAGCTRTKRSTSGGVLFRGLHCLGQWSRTQATIALSSGEAELNAALKEVLS